jgi:hypothetical protein
MRVSSLVKLMNNTYTAVCGRLQNVQTLTRSRSPLEAQVQASTAWIPATSPYIALNSCTRAIVEYASISCLFNVTDKRNRNRSVGRALVTSTSSPNRGFTPWSPGDTTSML